MQQILTNGAFVLIHFKVSSATRHASAFYLRDNALERDERRTCGLGSKFPKFHQKMPFTLSKSLTKKKSSLIFA